MKPWLYMGFTSAWSLPLFLASPSSPSPVHSMTDQPPAPARASSLDTETIHKLEKRINERPEKQELVERNIMKDDRGIAPKLVAARGKLERSQLEDKLDHALKTRPKPEEVVKDGILHADEVPS
ncbi:hypothetical protein HGRIS_002236 [Hohenbuehelia grisea]|uniref:Uncharacterized protein n=1 Tax=Hohenbuehelia grisea TaxID=104357 RepID=A0ABR3JK33_9AGAR